MKHRPGFAALAAVLAFTISGCGGHGNGESTPSAAVVDPTTAGSITGTVTLDGAPPVSKPIDMSASPACVQANSSPVVPPIVVTGENGAFANVVIYVKDGLGHYRYDTPPETAVLAQKNCMYVPHIVALMTDQPFEIQNNDPTMHNVHPMPKHNRPVEHVPACRLGCAQINVLAPGICDGRAMQRASVDACRGVRIRSSVLRRDVHGREPSS